MKFWDASAVIPLCLEEPWTSELQAIAEADQTLVVWWGTPIECTSAFARLRREGVLRDTDEDQARMLLERLATVWTEIQPTHEVREQAKRALRLHPLRAADAQQLAAALVWTQGRPSHHAFVCLDRRLRQAAHREGFLLLPVAERL